MIKTLAKRKKAITLTFVFLFTVFGIQLSHASYYPSGIQQNVSEQTLINNGWIKFYEENYGTFLDSSGTAIRPRERYVILTGKAVGNSSLPVLAAAPTAQVFTETVRNTPQLVNGTYWYYTPDYSIGFAPSATVDQRTADVENISDPLRLSWHLHDYTGGFRLGDQTYLNSGTTGYLKQVWSWDGTRGGHATAAVRQTHNLSFSQSLYGSDKLSDPDGELKKTVDSIEAKYGDLIK